MSNILKNTKDVVKKMEEIINEKEPIQGKIAQPNRLKLMNAASKLNRAGNERT